MHGRTRRGRRTAVIGAVVGALTVLAVAASGNAVDTTTPTPAIAATSTPASTANTTAVAGGAIPPALLQRRNEVFDRIARLGTTLGKRAGFDFSVGVNPDTNTLVVDVFSDKSVKLPDLGAALRVENHVGGQLSDQVGASGGAPAQREGAGICTMGFAVRIKDSPDAPTGFFTVAHCFDETKPAASNKFRIRVDNGTIINGGVGHKYANRPADTDWGVVAFKKEIDSNAALGQVRAFANKPTLPVAGLREPVVGMKVCKHGAVTRTTCGEVTAVGVKRSARGIISDSLIQASLCTENGDSGGPLFTGRGPNGTTVEGVGLAKGGESFPDPKNPNGRKVCGEKVGKPNISFFVPLSLALAQANAQAPQNDISLLTQ